MLDVIEPEAMAQLLVAVAGRVARRAPDFVDGYDTDRAIAALGHDYYSFSDSEVIINVAVRLLNGFPDAFAVPDADTEIIRRLMSEEMVAMSRRVAALPLD